MPRTSKQTKSKSEGPVFDELQEQAMRAINAVFNARGIPSCVKRALGDALEEAAKTAGVSEPSRQIWIVPGVDGQHFNALLWEVFESPAVKDLLDLPRKAEAPARRESKPKGRLRKLELALEHLDQEFLPDDDPQRLLLLSRIAATQREAARDEWPDVIEA